MRGSGAETRAFPIKMRAEYGLPGNSLIARRAAGSKSNSGSGKGQQGQQGQQRQQRKQGRQGNAGREKGGRRAGGVREECARAVNLSVPVHGKKFLLYLHNYAIARKRACVSE